MIEPPQEPPVAGIGGRRYGFPPAGSPVLCKLRESGGCAVNFGHVWSGFVMFCRVLYRFPDLTGRRLAGSQVVTPCVSGTYDYYAMCVSRCARDALQGCCTFASEQLVVSGVITPVTARERIVRTH